MSDLEIEVEILAWCFEIWLNRCFNYFVKCVSFRFLTFACLQMFMQLIVEKEVWFASSTLTCHCRWVDEKVMRNVVVLKTELDDSFFFVLNEHSVFVKIEIVILIVDVFLLFVNILEFLVIIFVISLLQRSALENEKIAKFSLIRIRIWWIWISVRLICILFFFILDRRNIFISIWSIRELKSESESEVLTILITIVRIIDLIVADLKESWIVLIWRIFVFSDIAVSLIRIKLTLIWISIFISIVSVIANFIHRFDESAAWSQSSSNFLF